MIDAIVAWPNLCAAWTRVADNAGSAGPDAVSIDRFARNWEEHLRTLGDLVRIRRYRPGSLRRVVIPKRDGGQRLLRIPNVGDRVMQRAALNVLEPLLERQFLPCSYGYRPRRGVRDAIAAVVRLRELGQRWVLDADIDNCFDSIDHRLLLDFLKEDVRDAQVVWLLHHWLLNGRCAQEPDRGLAQGMPISPLLCNIYLHRLDKALTRGRWLLVRYADDFVVCCSSPGQVVEAQRAVEQALARLKLRCAPAKTRAASFFDGFEFLGARFERETVQVLWEERLYRLDEATPDWLWQHLPVGY